MRTLGNLIDTLVYDHVGIAWLPSLATFVLIALWSPARDLLPLQISGAQNTLYEAIATASTTLLGFSIAVVALFAGLRDRSAIGQVRSQRLLERSVRQVGRACVAIGLALAVALLGLVLDRPPAEAAHASAQLGCGSYWIWMVPLTVFPAAVLLSSSTANVIRMVTLATRDNPS